MAYITMHFESDDVQVSAAPTTTNAKYSIKVYTNQYRSLKTFTKSNRALKIFTGMARKIKSYMED